MIAGCQALGPRAEGFYRPPAQTSHPPRWGLVRQRPPDLERPFGTARIALSDSADFSSLPSDTSRLIGQPLTNDTTKYLFGASLIVNPKGDAVAVPEIELGHVAMHMALAGVLVNALHATLEDAEIALDGLSVDGRIGKGHPFFALVIDVSVIRELATMALVVHRGPSRDRSSRRISPPPRGSAYRYDRGRRGWPASRRNASRSSR